MLGCFGLFVLVFGSCLAVTTISLQLLFLFLFFLAGRLIKEFRDSGKRVSTVYRALALHVTNLGLISGIL